MGDFAEETKDMSSVEILNYYRNLYHAEPNTTEQGIVAWAINDILPKYVNEQEIRAKVIDEFAEKVIAEYHQLPTTLGYTEQIISEIANQMKGEEYGR